MKKLLSIIVASLLITSESYAQSADSQGAGSLFGSFFPLIAIFLIFYFFVIRPQSRKLKEHTKMIESLHRGDKVITAGGIEGTIVKVIEGSDKVEVEIAQGVTVKVIKATITNVASLTVHDDEKKNSKPDAPEKKSTKNKSTAKKAA